MFPVGVYIYIYIYMSAPIIVSARILHLVVSSRCTLVACIFFYYKHYSGERPSLCKEDFPHISFDCLHSVPMKNICIKPACCLVAWLAGWPGSLPVLLLFLTNCVDFHVALYSFDILLTCSVNFLRFGLISLSFSPVSLFLCSFPTKC